MQLIDIFSNYAVVRQEMVQTVRSLKQEHLDWTMPHHPATIGKLLAHIALCEHFWMDIAVGKLAEHPDVEVFESAHDLPTLLNLLDAQARKVIAYLETESCEDWDEVFYSYVHPGGERESWSKRFVTWRVVEHQARHRGQIFMIMRMQELEVPNV